jgi:hypothetical protein
MWRSAARAVAQHAPSPDDARDAARWRAAVRLHVVPKYIPNYDKPDDDWTVEEYIDREIASTSPELPRQSEPR